MYPRIHSEVSYQRGVVDGGAKRDRTADLLRARQALSQLSYSPIEFLQNACLPGEFFHRQGVTTRSILKYASRCHNAVWGRIW